MGATFVECLWIFYELNRGHHCWYRIDGRLLGRFSSISSGVKKKYSSKIYRPRRPANTGPGGLNNAGAVVIFFCYTLRSETTAASDLHMIIQGWARDVDAPDRDVKMHVVMIAVKL